MKIQPSCHFGDNRCCYSGGSVATDRIFSIDSIASVEINSTSLQSDREYLKRQFHIIILKTATYSVILERSDRIHK